MDNLEDSKVSMDANIKYNDKQLTSRSATKQEGGGARQIQVFYRYMLMVQLE